MRTDGGGTSLRNAAVLLVGHGSHISADSAQPVRDLAERLRSARTFGEVHVAFWKEEPQLCHAFHLLERSEVFIVPIFTSEGYFTDRVIPRELSLDATLEVRPALTVHWCPPVGTHPRMARVVLERAREAASLSSDEQRQATLVVAGHGTDRHAGSGTTTRNIADWIRGTGEYREVSPAFLDQVPRLSDVIKDIRSRNTIVVPFFISDGWHAGTTIPEDLAVTGGRRDRSGSTLWYGKPVGSHPAMTEVVVELVAQAVAREFPISSMSAGSPMLRARLAPSPAALAREAFIDWIGVAGVSGRVFLQTFVREVQSGRFEVRHVHDRIEARSHLRQLGGPKEVAELSATTAAGQHRPLRTSPDLRGGWVLTSLGPEELWEVYSYLYPAAPVHWYLKRQGCLSIRSYDAVAGRQTGIYAGVKALGEDDVVALSDTLCQKGCLRTPVWGPGERERASPADRGPILFPQAEAVPCPEPCSLFITRAREALDSRSRSE